METPNIREHAAEKLLRPISFSSRLLEIRWHDHFPLELPACGCSVRIIEAEEAFDFIRTHYREIFELDQRQNPFLSEGTGQAKAKFYEEAGDFFLICKGATPIGIFVGTLSDWSTYYFRSAGMLRAYQGNGAIPRLLGHLFEILAAHGVERIDADASPSNFASIQTLLRARFNVSGIQLSERWGALLRFTKFLSKPCETVFLNQFCHGVRPQSSN